MSHRTTWSYDANGMPDWPIYSLHKAWYWTSEWFVFTTNFHALVIKSVRVKLHRKIIKFLNMIGKWDEVINCNLATRRDMLLWVKLPGRRVTAYVCVRDVCLFVVVFIYISRKLFSRVNVWCLCFFLSQTSCMEENGTFRQKDVGEMLPRSHGSTLTVMKLPHCV